MSKYKEDIIRLRELGYNYNQIVDELGCAKSTVCYYLGVDQRSKTRERTRDSRNTVVRFLQEYKQGKKCTDCDEQYPYWVLEFDHLRDKKFTVSAFRVVGASLDDVKEEIKKCELVCANCHRIRTHFRKTSINSPEVLDLSDVY